MPQLSIAKTYANGTVLFEADLDEIKDAIELLINTTGIDEDNIQDGAVVTDLLAASAVTGAKIADEAITTSLLASDSATSTTIADDAVTSDKIAASAVTTAKILDANVTYEKIAANEGSATLSGTITNSYTDLSNGGVDLTTNGRSVLIECFNGYLTLKNGSGSTPSMTIQLKRDSDILAVFQFTVAGGLTGLKGFVPVSSIVFLDQTPTAGDYTYTLEAREENSTSVATISGTMYVREL